MPLGKSRDSLLAAQEAVTVFQGDEDGVAEEVLRGFGQADQSVGDDGQQVVEKAFGFLVDLPTHCAPAVVIDVGHKDVGVAAGGLNQGRLAFQELFENDFGGCGRPEAGLPLGLRARSLHAGLDSLAQAAHDRLGLTLFVFRQAFGAIDQRQSRAQSVGACCRVRAEGGRRCLAQYVHCQRDCKLHDTILTAPAANCFTFRNPDTVWQAKMEHCRPAFLKAAVTLAPLRGLRRGSPA